MSLLRLILRVNSMMVSLERTDFATADIGKSGGSKGERFRLCFKKMTRKSSARITS